MGRKVNKAGRFARHGTDAGSGMGCKSPRVGHCDARMPRSVRYVRTRPVLLPSPGVYGRFMLSARLVAVRTFCLALLLPRKAPSGKLHNPCAFRTVFADPPLRCAVSKQNPLRRWEPLKGDFFILLYSVRLPFPAGSAAAPAIFPPYPPRGAAARGSGRDSVPAGRS